MAGKPDEGQDVAIANTVAPDAGVAETAASTPSIASDATLASGDGQVVGPDRELPDVKDDRYQLGNEVGRGGLGRVLKARDDVLDRPVAVKELLTTDPGSHRRFVREALITARLQHPSIIPVYDAGRRNGRSPFYAMKLVGGRPLDRAISEAKTLAERLALLPQVLAVADAIAYAHSQRIIHRDLKPANVLVGEFGETIVIDWGLAKDLSVDDREARSAGPFRSVSTEHTVEGSVLGTPGYMAPEQAAGEDVDERADVYALGAILYHVVSGKMPHEGTTIDEVIEKVIKGEVKPLRQRVKEVPSDLAAIVDKAMATDPAARYPTARELAEDLRRFQTGQLVGARRYSIVQRLVRWIARHRAIAAVSAVATIVLAVFAAWSINRISKERDEAIVNANRAIINQARALVEQDPPAALAWLRQLSLDGPGWDSARTIAAGALAHPRLDLLLHGALSASPTADGRYAVGVSTSGVWIGDLTSGTQMVVPYAWTEQPALELCDDSRHAFVRTTDADDSDVLEADLVAKKLTQTKQEWQKALRSCQRGQRLSIGGREHGPGVRMLDPASDDDNLIFVHSMEAGWLAADGAHVVTLDMNGSLLRFDVKTKQHQDLESAIDLTPPQGMNAQDMKPDAVISDDGAVIVIVVFTRATYCDIPGRYCTPISGEIDRNIRSIAVAPDGSWAMGRTRERSWRLSRKIAWPDSGTVPPGDLSVSHDGAWVLGVFEGKATLLEVAAGTLHRVHTPSRMKSASFLADSRLLTVGQDASVRVWTPKKTGAPHELINFRWAKYSPATRWLLIEDGDRMLRRPRESQRFEQLTYEGRENPAFEVGDNGDVAKLTRKGELSLWKRGGHEWAALGSHAGGVDVAMNMLANGTLITYSGASLAIWERSPPRYIAIPDGSASAQRLHMDVDERGERALIACGAEGYCVVELRSGKVDRLPQSRGRAAMSRDGRVAITGGSGKTHLVWDLAARRVRRSLPAADIARGVLGMSHDGRHAMILSEAGVDLVDLERGTHTPLRSASRPMAAWFSPDGRSVLDTTPMLWDVASGEGRPVLEGFDIGGFDITNDAVIAVSRQGIITIADDLPREPAALAKKLAAMPYRLDDKDRLTIAR